MLIKTDKSHWLAILEQHNNKHLNLSPLSKGKDKRTEYFLLSQEDEQLNGFAYLALYLDDRGYYYQLAAFDFFVPTNITNEHYQRLYQQQALPFCYSKLLGTILRDYINKQTDCAKELIIHSAGPLLKKAVTLGHWQLSYDYDFNTDVIATIDFSNDLYDMYVNDFFFNLPIEQEQVNAPRY